MYNGGKNGEGVLQAIINQIPPHTIYIEPFLGSGAIIKNKKPALRNIGIEIDAGTIDKFHQGARYTVINDCAISYLQNLLCGPETFIYCDPPYPFSTRRSSRALYNYEFTDEQHKQLLKILLAMPAAIAISSYANPIYDALLKGWRVVDFPAMTRQGLATERLYCNYGAPTVLHDYTFLGKDFTERQRIKRKIKRHVTRLLKLPMLERAAIVEAINASVQSKISMHPGELSTR